MHDLLFPHLTGVTVYAIVRDNDGDVWNGSAFETYSAGNLGTYDIPLTEQGTSGFYAANFPSGIATSDIPYAVTAHQQPGASPVEGDLLIGSETYYNTLTEIRVVTEEPKLLVVPNSGTETYELYLTVYDYSGALIALDGDPAVVAENMLGTDRSSNLGSVVNIATGRYKVDYDVTSGHADEQIIVTWSPIKDGVTREKPISFLVHDVFDPVNDEVLADVQKIIGDTDAADNLLRMYKYVITNGAVNDASPTATVFETTLTKASTFFDDAILIFWEGPAAGQARRVSAYLETNGETTVTPALTYTPLDTNQFLVLGRIE